MAQILQFNKKPKAVKNLGWLIKHFSEITHFNFYAENDIFHGGIFVCFGYDKNKVPYTFVINFASLSVCELWLKKRKNSEGKVFNIFINYRLYKEYKIGFKETSTINFVENNFLE